MLSNLVKEFIAEVKRSGLYFVIPKIRSYSDLDDIVSKFNIKVEEQIKLEQLRLAVSNKINKCHGDVTKLLKAKKMYSKSISKAQKKPSIKLETEERSEDSKEIEIPKSENKEIHDPVEIIDDSDSDDLVFSDKEMTDLKKLSDQKYSSNKNTKNFKLQMEKARIGSNIYTQFVEVETGKNATEDDPKKAAKLLNNKKLCIREKFENFLKESGYEVKETPMVIDYSLGIVSPDEAKENFDIQTKKPMVYFMQFNRYYVCSKRTYNLLIESCKIKGLEFIKYWVN